MAGMLRTALVAGAALLVGYWLGQRQAAPSAPAPAPPAPFTQLGAPASVQTQAAPLARTFPHTVPPIESATPAEIAALRQAEVVNSQARPAVATYKGSDGRQHAFRYEPTPAEAAAQRAREERERELMQELQADPAAFAKKYGLRAREIERILDGTMPFPPAMLE